MALLSRLQGMKAVRPLTKLSWSRWLPSMLPRLMQAFEAEGIWCLHCQFHPWYVQLMFTPEKQAFFANRRSQWPSLSTALQSVWCRVRTSGLIVCGVGGVENGRDAAEFIWQELRLFCWFNKSLRPYVLHTYSEQAY